MIGNRDAKTAKLFIIDLAARLKNRVHLTTDGNKAYLSAVENAFGCDIDYGMLVKVYGTPEEKEHRYSQSECVGTVKEVISGNPDSFSTSFVERQYLTMSMSMRRLPALLMRSRGK